MWIVGTIIVLIAGAAVTAALGWAPRPTSPPPLWDILKQGGAHAGNVATYAGFSLAVATFIAGLDVARTSPAFATVFGMLLVSFLILVVAGWIAGSAPTITQAEASTDQSLAFVLGNLCGNLGISITWLALAPLLALVGLPALIDVFNWSSLFMVLAGSGWVALVAYRLTQARALACWAIPVLGVALPALYRLLAVRQWPALWPTSDAALRFTFVALAAAGLIFALHFGLLVAHGSKEFQQRLRLEGHRIALVSSQAYVIVVALIWFAVAIP